MPEHKTTNKQGPFEGSRCLAGLGGNRWALATIQRVYEDGSFKIEFDNNKKSRLAPYWYGVTSAEISFDDADKWPSVFGRLSANQVGFTKADCRSSLAILGISVSDAEMQQFWIQSCRELFYIEAEKAEELILDREQAYKLFLHAGFCAKQFEESLKASSKLQRYFKLYWNQTRMGGREPSEICRPVMLEDAFAALGVSESGVDVQKATFLKALEEKHSVLLPDSLKKFLCQWGVERAVTDVHPNNPELLPLGDKGWELQSINKQGLKGDYAIPIMIPHQGDHEWAAVFYDDEDDARVYVRWDEGEYVWDEKLEDYVCLAQKEVWKLTAPTIEIFFWDLAQTGLNWFQDTKFLGGKPVKKTDIGLILDQSLRAQAWSWLRRVAWPLMVQVRLWLRRREARRLRRTITTRRPSSKP